VADRRDRLDAGAAEIASIRGFHFLQLIYFVTGAMILWWTPTFSPSAQGSDN
jgi:hypothetical protein